MGFPLLLGRPGPSLQASAETDTKERRLRRETIGAPLFQVARPEPEASATPVDVHGFY
jgi:hypothetical protein